MKKETKREVQQWHPAFFACLQVEFEEEKDKLIFEEEHLLGTKPTQIDVVIIKKDDTVAIHKNIGQIFRKYNIIEYKSPKDYLCIDDFYKVYAYACFYKSDSARVNEININDITLTFVSKNFPRKFANHLQNTRHYRIQKNDNGIYEITGDIFPMQLIVTKDLTQANNLWLHNLTDELESHEAIRTLIAQYQLHKYENLYESVMNVIVGANQKDFEEEKPMCEALRKLMKDEIEEGIAQGLEQGITQGIEQGIQILIETCHELGLSKEDTFTRVESKFKLSKDDTEKYLVEFWI